MAKRKEVSREKRFIASRKLRLYMRKSHTQKRIGKTEKRRRDEQSRRKKKSIESYGIEVACCALWQYERIVLNSTNNIRTTVYR